MLYHRDELFPAYAGVILEDSLCVVHLVPFPRIRGGDPVAMDANPILLVFPRICGGDPGGAGDGSGRNLFSPHMRG